MIQTSFIVSQILKICGKISYNQSTEGTAADAITEAVDQAVAELNNVCKKYAPFRAYPTNKNLNMTNWTQQENSMYSSYDFANISNDNGIAEITSLSFILSGTLQLMPVNFIGIEEFYALPKVSFSGGGTIPYYYSFDGKNKTLVCTPPIATNIFSGAVVRCRENFPTISYEYIPRAFDYNENIEIKITEQTKNKNKAIQDALNLNLSIGDLEKEIQNIENEYQSKVKTLQEKKELMAKMYPVKQLRVDDLPEFVFTPSTLELENEEYLKQILINKTAIEIADYLQIQISDSVKQRFAQAIEQLKISKVQEPTGDKNTNNYCNNYSNDAMLAGRLGSLTKFIY